MRSGMLNKTAFDIWQEELQEAPIITLCKPLDRSLNRGVPVGKITEFCGFPGSGKTHICYQLCINVQLPKKEGFTEGNAVFIDTNQGFNPFRLKEIADHICAIVCRKFQDAYRNILTGETILQNIQYTYCEDYEELLNSIDVIIKRIKPDNQENVKLIVIDSLSFPFRRLDINTERTKIIHCLLTKLQKLADQFKIAIVVTNELTTRFLKDDKHQFLPALGDSHSHKIGQRILLSSTIKNGVPEYTAYLEKCYSSPKKLILFKITDGGIRGIQ